jgi:hypothetical protein
MTILYIEAPAPTGVASTLADARRRQATWSPPLDATTATTSTRFFPFPSQQGVVP